MELILKISDLVKEYPGNPPIKALRGISLNVSPSSFVIITGPSGSGKSTLLNIIGTLERPSGGEVLVADTDISILKSRELAEFRRSRFGFIFQTFNLLNALTALENVILPVLPYKRFAGYDVDERARDLLVQVGLSDRMEHLPGQLSGGEQQRVAIARALINHPSIILADEPTGNLDTQNGGEIIDLLRKLNRNDKITVLLVTHNPSVRQAGDRTVSLRDGFLEQEYA